MIEPFQLSVAENTLAAVLHLPAGRRPAPWVVLCHGLFSSMESDKFIELAELLSGSGIAALRFDFSGCGASTGSCADTTVSRRLRELETVFTHAAAHPELAPACGLMGSSLGGFVACLYAARFPVRALSLWATPCELAPLKDTFPSQDLQRLKPGFFTDAARYSLRDLRIQAPMQIIHGTHDEIVPISHAQHVSAISASRSHMILIPGADHSISDNRHRRQALDECCSWFQKQIGD